MDSVEFNNFSSSLVSFFSEGTSKGVLVVGNKHKSIVVGVNLSIDIEDKSHFGLINVCVHSGIPVCTVILDSEHYGRGSLYLAGGTSFSLNFIEATICDDSFSNIREDSLLDDKVDTDYFDIILAVLESISRVEMNSTYAHLFGED